MNKLCVRHVINDSGIIIIDFKKNNMWLHEYMNTHKQTIVVWVDLSYDI